MENENFQNDLVESNKKDGMAIASLVLGILSVVCCVAWYVSILCGALALIFGIISKRNGNPNGKGLSTAGIVLSIIGLVLSVSLVIIGLVMVNSEWYQNLVSQYGINNLR